MLAAWMRMKYPMYVQGALASSAPVLYFNGSHTASPDGYSIVASNAFKATYPDKRCSLGIREGFEILKDIKSRNGDWGQLRDDFFHVCDPINHGTDVQNLMDYIQQGFLFMAMTNYPYEANFLEPMPAWPVKAACDFFKDVPPREHEPQNRTNEGLGYFQPREKLVLGAMNQSINVYYNYTGQTKCHNTNNTSGFGNLKSSGFDLLKCRELAVTTGFSNYSMFLPDEFDFVEYSGECQEKYNVTPNYNWAWNQFGGQMVTYDFKPYSKIIFSNGLMDPWAVGGVTLEVNKDLPIFLIKNAAHHLDLRLPNEVDIGTDVEAARN